MKNLERVSLVDQTIKALIQYIDADSVNIGDKMPSETVICAKYQVSRTTVREALRMLQAMGYVELIQNRGFFILNKKVSNNSDAKFWMLTHAREVLDVLEVRSVLEPLAVKLAVKQAKEEEIYGIIGLKTLFEEAAKRMDQTAMSTYDEEFHNSIIAAAQNAFLKSINEVITVALRKFRSKTFAIDEKGALATGAHAKIVEAIVARDSEKAEKYMLEHMQKNIEIMMAYLKKEGDKA
jgi:GntR family transcriptional repressor for pyruvate dehydrogenase complex